MIQVIESNYKNKVIFAQKNLPFLAGAGN